MRRLDWLYICVTLLTNGCMVFSSGSDVVFQRFGVRDGEKTNTTIHFVNAEYGIEYDEVISSKNTLIFQYSLNRTTVSSLLSIRTLIFCWIAYDLSLFFTKAIHSSSSYWTKY